MTHRLLHGGSKAASLLAALGCTLLTVGAAAQGTHPTAVAPTEAATPAPEDAFSFELGRAAVDRDVGASSTYLVASTQDYGSKLTGGKVRLSVAEKDAAGTQTHFLTINAGKHKTVAQLTGTLAEIFRKYLAVPAANQEIGKIGDLNHGGEIHFAAESADSLRYDWMTPGEPAHSTRFKKSDIQIFLGILTHPKAGS